jgi:hypothetical protein
MNTGTVAMQSPVVVPLDVRMKKIRTTYEWLKNRLIDENAGSI